MTEENYERVTYGITMAAAQILSRLNPGMIFIYVSGSGTDSSERRRIMWARVKGKTENALLRLPFKAAYMSLASSNRSTELTPGRRSIAVLHLGQTFAYFAPRSLAMIREKNSSVQCCGFGSPGTIPQSAHVDISID